LPIDWSTTNNHASGTFMPFRDTEIDKLLTAGRIATDPDETDRTQPGLEPERRPAADDTSGAADDTGGATRKPPPPRSKRLRAWLLKRSRNS
jgi:hypothetical protein